LRGPASKSIPAGQIYTIFGLNTGRSTPYYMSKSLFCRAMDREGKDKDIYGYEKRLEDAMRVLAGSRMAERNKETIRRFIDHLRVQGVSTGRLAKYAYHLKVIGEMLGTGKDFEDCTRKDIM